MMRERAKEFVLQWIRGRQGSAAELVRAIQEEIGWPARLVLPSILDELRGSRELPDAGRKYLRYTLSGGEMTQALAEGATPDQEHQSSLDQLFGRSRRFRRSRKFAEAVEFVAKFPEYSPFNNMLAYLQNPMATYFATARHWHKAFGRSVKEDARGMVLLAPRTPVLLVYDIGDTEGPPLPDKMRVFSETPGRFNPAILDRTIKNAQRDRIRIERKPMGQLRGGFATTRMNDSASKMRIGLREDLDAPAAYSVLCHELAHIYLGHVGADLDGWWPYRVSLTEAVAEIEAESVAYIICRRANLETRSVEYLSSYVEDNSDIDAISLDLVSRVAGRIEDMGRRLMPPRESVAK
ncbi:MAG TPA: hypothetical protein VH619_02165 [Verrucomicrobiae bacterium]|jgi:hypothetical protein|nr:hypothetical protein [Verrucomicrobiae bacterium]